MLSKDINLAQKIIVGKYHAQETNDIYHNTSFIYKFTNEKVNEYQKYLEGKEKVFSITASGDQILNSILEGTKEIDTCDISRFPKYFFELKKAAIKTLTREEYIEAFIANYIRDDEAFDGIYFSINKNLEADAKKFWDSLFYYYDASDIYRPPLFSSEILTEKTVIERNKYLQDNNYDKLKENLDNCEINHYIGDIREIVKKTKKKYDLVNLSSIIYYGFDKIKNYQELLDTFNLEDEGIILSYLYNTKRNWIEELDKNQCIVEQFQNTKEGIMIYKKVR